MFNTRRYATPRLLMEIPLYMQNRLWTLIDTMNVESQDYLHILELSEMIIDGKPMQKIIRNQENPLYFKEHTIPVKKAVNVKIFVIDDGPHSTMLLSDEY